MYFGLEVLSTLRRDAAHSDKGCTLDTCPVSYSVYGYLPNKPLNMVFLVVFAISLVWHVFLGVRRRAWSFIVALGIGSLMEVIGNGAMRTYIAIIPNKPQVTMDGSSFTVIHSNVERMSFLFQTPLMY
jgi:hypothetical protein